MRATVYYCDMTSLNDSVKEVQSQETDQQDSLKNALVHNGRPAGLLGTRERFWPACISTLVASILSLLMGFTIAFPSAALPVLLGSWREAQEYLPNKHYLFSTELADTFGALAPVGAVLGGPLGGWIADRQGRKFSLMFCSVPYVLGYLLLSYGHYTSTATGFKAILLTGRFFSGIGMGWASTTTSIYIGEISSSRLRGLFGSIMQVYLALGILLCYGIGTSFVYYHVALGVVMVTSLFVVLCVWLRETPRWLLANGRLRTALKTLKWLRGPDYNVHDEFNTMKEALSQTDTTAPWREFTKKSILIPFVTLLVVFFFQQIGGLNAQGAYGAVIFKDAGVPKPQFTLAIAVGISVVTGTVASAFIVDKIGRKPLLVISGIGMGIGSTLLGTHFYLTRPGLCSGNGAENFLTDADSSGKTMCNTQFAPLAIVSMITYNLLFAVGWGPVPWILLPELLPLKVRGTGGGLAALVNWATAALITGTYLSYAETITPWFAWWSFAVLNFLSVVFVLVALVETKGKSLEVIWKSFEKRWNSII